MCFQWLEKNRNLGFLFLRLGIGTMFIFHGWGKLSGGPEVLEKIGQAVSYFGIYFGHPIFGLLAALSEFIGGICIILGLFFRPACFFLFCTMAVAVTMHLSQGDGLKTASHAIEAAVLFLSLIFIGPGVYNLDEKICSQNKKK